MKRVAVESGEGGGGKRMSSGGETGRRNGHDIMIGRPMKMDHEVLAVTLPHTWFDSRDW